MKSKTNFRAIYTLFVALVMSIACLGFTSISATVAQAESSVVSLTGEGNSDNPYTIASAEELKVFRDNVNNGDYAGKYIYVKLAQDIDLNNEEWTPLGSSSNAFQGFFDGNGKTVKNVKVQADAQKGYDYKGFFGLLGNNPEMPAQVKNITLDTISVTGGYNRVAAFAGTTFTAKIENVLVKNATVQARGSYVGGIVGHGYTTMTNCGFEGSVEGGAQVGGLQGTCLLNATNCYAIADVYATNYVVGGLFGMAQPDGITTIKGCYFEGSVGAATNWSDTNTAGGLLGITYITNAVLENNYVNAKVQTARVDVAAPVVGSFNCVIDSTVDVSSFASNSWNREKIDVDTFEILEVADDDPSDVPENVQRNNNLVVLESDVQYVDAKDINEVIIMDISKYDATKIVVEQELIEAKVVENNTVAVINGSIFTSFSDALTFAKTLTGEVVVEIFDKVTLNQNLSGSFETIKFIGKTEEAEIYLEVQGYITAQGKKVAFEDLILSKSAGGYITNAGFMNVAFGVYQAEEVSYNNCVLLNGAYAASSRVNFTNCTFKKSYDKYGLWAYGNTNVTIDTCVFDNYRGIKMYDEGKGAQNDTVITVKNTDFSALVGEDSKPAIVLTYGQSVTLEENTYSNAGVFELDLDGKPNGTEVSFVDNDEKLACVNDNGACGVLVNGKIYITVEDALDVAKKGDVITLLHNSTETVVFPVDVTIDYNGFTAENVKNEALQIADIKIERNAEDNSTIIAITYTNTDRVTTIVIPDGKDGANGSNGTNGVDGVNGKDGIGIKNAEVNENGELIITYTDNTFTNLGVVVGTNGTNGTNGVDGVNGKDGQNTSNGFAITATVIGSIALLSNIAMLLFFFLKKRA